MMREQTLIPGFATRFSFVELTLRRMPIFTRRSRASTFQILSARLSKNSTMVTFASDTSLPRHTSTSRRCWLRTCGGFDLRTIVTLMPETASASFRTAAFFFPLVTSTFSSFNATHSLSILDHCSCFSSSVPGVKVSQSKFLIYTSLHHCLHFLIIWHRYLLMNLHVVQFQYSFELRGLTYCQFFRLS